MGSEPHDDILMRPHKGMPLHRRLRSPDAYGALFFLILLTNLVTALPSSWRLVVPLMQALMLLFALRTSRANTRLTRIAFFAVPVAAGAGIFLRLLAQNKGAGAATNTGTEIAAGVLGLFFISAAIVAIAQRIGTYTHVNLSTIMGALCVYLMIGLFYASLFELFAAVNHGHFFANQTSQTTNLPVVYVYFSYTTLTTVGYGDFTAGGNLGRMIAVSEALIGQLYLVSVVALVVSNLGQPRRSRSKLEEETVPDE